MVVLQGMIAHFGRIVKYYSEYLGESQLVGWLKNTRGKENGRVYNKAAKWTFVQVINDCSLSDTLQHEMLQALEEIKKVIAEDQEG